MRFFKDYATPGSVMVLAGVMLVNHFYEPAVAPPAPVPAPVTPTLDGAALGKAYGTALLTSYADAWIVAAEALDQGKSVGDAQKALQDAWKDGRTKAFKATVEPTFAQVLPAGAEPVDPAKRAQVSALWRSFASGLKGGH